MQATQEFPKRLTVHVTKEDIKNGERASKVSCPIALALKRLFPTEQFTLQVESFNVYIRSDPYFVSRYIFSKEAAQFIQDFDHKNKVQPATFTLRRAL